MKTAFFYCMIRGAPTSIPSEKAFLPQVIRRELGVRGGSECAAMRARNNILASQERLFRFSTRRWKAEFFIFRFSLEISPIPASRRWRIEVGGCGDDVGSE
jgi:hypothetical protein